MLLHSAPKNGICFGIKQMCVKYRNIEWVSPEKMPQDRAHKIENIALICIF